MDRDKIIGISLLVVLFIAYLLYNKHEQKLIDEHKVIDTVSKVNVQPTQIPDSNKTAQNEAVTKSQDTLTTAEKSTLPLSYYGKADTVNLENKKLLLKFSTKGAFPVSANIKDYLTYYKKPLLLFNGMGNMLSAIIPVDGGKPSSELYFIPTVKDGTNGDKILDFTAELKDGKKAEIIYTLPANDYMMSVSIVLTGFNTNNPLTLHWNSYLLPSEKDISNERQSTQIYYHQKNEERDNFTLSNEEKTINPEGAVTWLGFRKQFFSSVLVSEDGFGKTQSKFYCYKENDTLLTAQNLAVMQLPVKPGVQQTANFRWYIGPNDYNTLCTYKLSLDEMVPLGVGIMSFVKYINKYALIPFFYFLNRNISNYALIIVIMTITIRLILSFFTYKSYLSSAKMRVMKPELDELKAKCGDDTQKFSVEQMKLYRSAGVNPLGGCLPMLIQLPILLSMYYMFPSFIEFRQKSFLWADDLSSYDSIFNFHYNIPFYGDHVSLFCLLMTASSLFLALYNRNMTPQDPNNPMMKYMPYIFPFMLMGVFNKMAAALTFYYTFSNLLSMLQQFVIQKYFIDEKAIHAKLQENKTKPATQSKWAQKLEEIQKIQAEKSKPVQRINKK